MCSLLRLLPAQRGLLGAEASLVSSLLQLVPRAAAGNASSSAQVGVRTVSTSSASSNVAASLSDVVKSESATPADVADAALALSYLQLKDQRRVWGIVLEKASDLKAGFDATSLTALLWAVTSSGVEHSRTLYELSGPALKLLGKFTPAQVAVATAAFGKAGVKDAALFDAIATKVTSSINDYTPAQLSSVLYGLAAVGSLDAATVATVSAKLAAAGDQLTASEAAQATWALAKLRRADKATLDAILKPAAGKLGKGEPTAHAVELLWGVATLSYAPSGVAAKAAASVKAGAASLTAEQAITAAWSLGILGAGDKDLLASLFTTAASALAAAPESIPLDSVAQLYEASVITGTSLPPAAAKYSEYIYSLVKDQRKLVTPQSVKDFKADLAQATAFAAGARYRPETEKAIAAFPRAVTPGLTVDIALDLGSSKVIVEGVDSSELTATLPATPLGSVAARAKVAEAAGYKLVAIPQTEYGLLGDVKAKAKYILSAIKRGVPGSGGAVDPLTRKVDAPVA